MRIKLPKKDSAGVVTAFYVRTLSLFFYFIFGEEKLVVATRELDQIYVMHALLTHFFYLHIFLVMICS